MYLKEYQVGAIGTNCYLAGNEQTKELLVIDPGGNAQELADRIDQSGYQPVAVLLTHGHFDHCMGARPLAERYGIPIYVHEADKEIMETPEYNCSTMLGKELAFDADKYFHGDGERLTLAGFDIEVLHTPGHTPGGVCFYIEKENTLFSGDTLFCGSVGRTDFPRGSMSQLVNSIREKLLPLSDFTKVLPGHDSQTLIGDEWRNNPFI